jgi:crossover junction endodeoxyribonuclease RuvC
VTRRIAAADPGQTGAIALITSDLTGIRLEALHDMPTYVEHLSDGRTRNRVCASGVADILRTLRPDILIAEKVAARSGQGVVSMFDFGRSLGLVEGVAAGLGIPVQMITPQAWVAHHGLTGQGKDGSRMLAASLFPEDAGRFKRKKDAGRSDAVLIAIAGAHCLKS